MTIASDIQKLTPGAQVELFELDCSAIGGAVLRFHNGVNELGADVVWDGLTYTRFPVEASGFERTGSGSSPRPKLRAANATGLVGALARELQDLINARLTRRRTLLRYLDAVNFPGSVNPTADPNAAFADEVWFVARKAGENGVYIELELSAAFDVTGVMIPRRQGIQNVCTAQYRSAECSYAGGAVADRNDVPTGSMASDSCGKRLASCKLRFGAYNPLPFGSFPGVGLVR